MKKLLSVIVTSTILVTLSILPMAGISCKKAPTGPRMTAPEVCQYVNQALRNEYISYSPTIRYEVRYTALSAVYGEAEGTWLVNVKVVAEPQRLSEGQWVVTRALEMKTFTQQYYFSETTGALTER